ncbi:hypothetical protein ACHAXN_005324 [Cyclotella atomus]
MIASSVSSTRAQYQSSCFVYGTLMASEVVQALIGRLPRFIPGVVLHNYVRHPVIGHVYPAVIPTNCIQNDNDNNGIDTRNNKLFVEGLLLLNLSPSEMKVFDYFEDEGVDYICKRVNVQLPRTAVDIADVDASLMRKNSFAEGHIIETNAYIWALGKDKLDTTKQWDYDAFCKNSLDWCLESTVIPCRKQFLTGNCND